MSDPEFVAFLEDMERVSRDWPLDYALLADLTIKGLRGWGCPFLSSEGAALDAFRTASLPGASLMNYNFCVAGGSAVPVKPLSYFW